MAYRPLGFHVKQVLRMNRFFKLKSHDNAILLQKMVCAAAA